MTPRECPVAEIGYPANIVKVKDACDNCPNRAPSPVEVVARIAELETALEAAIETMLDYGASKWRVDKARAALRKAGVSQ